jgi:DNA-binding transcriptional regulator YiaG
MWTKSGLKGLAGPRVQIQDVPRVRSGSPGRFLLKSEPTTINAPQAALVLAKRHLPLRQAYSVVTRLFDDGEAVVELPMVENQAALTEELKACNVIARIYGAPKKIDVRSIREATGLSQEDFALQFGLELATVRNWEQGRSDPDTAARNFLLTIARDPDAVRAALVRDGEPGSRDGEPGSTAELTP